MFNTLASQVAVVFVVAVCGFALLKGGETEKTVAGAYLLGWLASLVVQLQSGLEVQKWGVLIIDCIMLAVYAGFAWRSHASWLVWVVGLQLLAVASHLVILFNPETTANAFYTVLNLTAYAILIAMGIGTFWVWQERKAAELQ